MSIRITYYMSNLIFFIYPIPKGGKKNQLATFRVWGKQVDFMNLLLSLVINADSHLK